MCCKYFFPISNIILGEKHTSALLSYLSVHLRNVKKESHSDSGPWRKDLRNERGLGSIRVSVTSGNNLAHKIVSVGILILRAPSRGPQAQLHFLRLSKLVLLSAGFIGNWIHPSVDYYSAIKKCLKIFKAIEKCFHYDKQ